MLVTLHNFALNFNQYHPIEITTMQEKTRSVCETQMLPRETNSIDSHAYVKAFEK
jgi:hypothetical protein